MDKRLTKEVLLRAGVRTPEFFTFSLRGGSEAEFRSQLERTVEREGRRLPFPWVLKPVALGSSVGVKMFADSESFLQHGVALWSRVSSQAPEARGTEFLVEPRVGGRELTCGVVETDGVARALLPVELRPRASDFFDYDAKYTAGATEEICPASLSPRETAAVQEVAVEVHRLFRCEPLSRTDLFLDEEGASNVLEINTLPGMTETSLIPLSAERSGIALEELLEALVEHALRRGGRWQFAL
jgi:D-alanine-D-alanine ligase